MTALMANGWFWTGFGMAVLTAGIWLTLRLIGTGRIGTGNGRHKDTGDSGSEWAAEMAASLRATAVIPRVQTEDAPPWDYLPAPVIEPDTIISGPPEPEPDAYWLAAGTISDGQLRTVRVEVLPPPVEAILGHRTVDEAVESIFTRAMALKVRALTDGRS